MYPVRQPYLAERMKNMAYNLKYKAVGYIEEYDQRRIISAYQCVHMLGKLYQSDPSNLETVNHKIYSDFRNLIWLTYRCGFKELLPNIKSEYISDTGWGCMIRVGQMLLAEILKTHTRASNCQEIKHIAYHFKDCKEAALSIHRVANEGHRYFGIDPGKWYNPSQIAYVLSDILEKCKLEEAKDLVLKVFNNCNLFFDELLDAMAPKRNQCLQPGHAGHDGQLQKRVICTRCNVVDKSVAIVILVRMGYDKVQPRYLRVLNLMMESPYFRGVIGGKPARALYFVGCQNDDYIYLDPHYVQSAKQLANQFEEYSCTSFRKCKNIAIDPSAGICFYLRDLPELNHFYTWLNQLKTDVEQDMFIFVADRAPSYHQQEKLHSEEFEHI